MIQIRNLWCLLLLIESVAASTSYFSKINYEEEENLLIEDFQKYFFDIILELPFGTNKASDPLELVKKMKEKDFGQIVRWDGNVAGKTISIPQGRTATPVVQMHGMGDFAKNPSGMVPLARAISNYLGGAYVLNVQIGNSSIADFFNGFIMNLDDQVDYFANVVQEDRHLTNGFNAVGYSQGNLVIRGYIERYNNPPVLNFISMHGPLAGVASFPGCAIDKQVCVALDQLLGALAYTPAVQKHLAQANYFRDPLMIPRYLSGDRFLVDINNEKSPETVNATYSSNWASLHSLCLVKALGDTVVIPNDSEWLGFFKDGSLEEIWSYDTTPWYEEDYFGLKTLDLEKGNLYFNTTEGDHLDFSTDYLLELVGLYFQ
mmetsp:Transcript_29837/g.40994  ORF Transcript_29837/g.40994 Transcript_29837/m.40994 type:complete len:374 (-) Transcript_29837:308-1429(-)|eukprot:CAMPEP_0170066196 /NCGR_PEP_ID=MMETSP0019_2-20121128/5982_1 /TAXON_ID=98059 /ORGANISM="Dinobryon sp., Strain UTEXLB2267" /LENGTH=373 /DNA_ID=CAMNT_0010273221 /DNA_START=1024 /DNA_END=2145 /DNA_ORIENTATION=-